MDFKNFLSYITIPNFPKNQNSIEFFCWLIWNVPLAKISLLTCHRVKGTKSENYTRMDLDNWALQAKENTWQRIKAIKVLIQLCQIKGRGSHGHGAGGTSLWGILSVSGSGVYLASRFEPCAAQLCVKSQNYGCSAHYSQTLHYTNYEDGFWRVESAIIKRYDDCVRVRNEVTYTFHAFGNFWIHVK